jgi:hypothetical protein
MRFPNLLKAGMTGLLLASTACADGRVAGSAGEPAAKALGTMKVDGKTTELRHVYAFRTPYAEGEWKEQSKASIQVVLANEPVPDALLPKIEEALREGQRPSRSFSSGLEDILKGTSLRILVLSVGKQTGSDGRIQYDPWVCLDTMTVYATEPPEFRAFTVREGVVRGRASHTWKNDVFVTGASSVESREVACSFDVDFEVAIGGTPLPYAGHAAVDPLPPLAPGKAEGTFRIAKGSVPLTAVYARRHRIFFDEPEERILVMIANRPLSGAARLASLGDLIALPRENKLRGVRFTVTQNGNIIWSVPFDETGVLLSTNVFEVSECRIEGDRVIGKVTYKHDKDRVEYAVAFDVPITAG